jgi:hypothetical protein
MLMSIIATEFDLPSGKATGEVQQYDVKDMNEGRDVVLRVAKAKDARAEIGSTGRVIYPHGVYGDKALVLSRAEL